MDLAHLNDAQRRAVEHSPDAPLLVLAAAGTGKTETLTMRIAHMIEVCGVPHDRILAVTFSNRAAREMRERAARACDLPLHAITVGTFHSVCLRVMRMHPYYATREFTVLDYKDAVHAIAGLVAGETRGETRGETEGRSHLSTARPSDVYAVLNKWRNDCLEPSDVVPPAAYRRRGSDGKGRGAMDAESLAYVVYPKYRQLCDEQRCVDFADILCHAVRLCGEDPAFLESLRQRWTHVLVDEFQDTNEAQYRFIKLLADRGAPPIRITAVGDDCQTIHEHAGAKVERILDFPAEFPGTEVIPLELNYRSNGTILDAANRLISNSHASLASTFAPSSPSSTTSSSTYSSSATTTPPTASIKKQLICTKDAGVPIEVYAFQNEVHEAEGVARRIATQWCADGEYGKMCILYRINACSQPFEHALRKAKIPFRVAGSSGFFDRAEVRTAMAYLVAAVNPRSTEHVERAMRMPPRGIGDATMEKLRTLAGKSDADLVTAATVHRGSFSGRAVSGLARFLEAVAVGVSKCFDDAASLSECANGVLSRSGLAEHYRGRGEHEEAENVETLMAVVVRTATSCFSDGERSERGVRLAELVRRIVEEASSASSAQGENAEDPNVVTLMSIHRSKGLEWEHVHVAGFADGLMPYKMSIFEGNLDGERRLGYVAITRARSRLTFSWPMSRLTVGCGGWQSGGKQAIKNESESRFVREMMSAIETSASTLTDSIRRIRC